MKGKRIKKQKVGGHTKEITQLVERKYFFFQELIQKTIIHVESCKFFDILAISDMNRCVKMLKMIHSSLELMFKNLKDTTTEVIFEKSSRYKQ